MAREPMKLGEYIQQCRAERGMTLEQCSSAAGISKSYLHELENNRSIPSLAIAAALTLILKADLQTMALLSLRAGVNEGEK